MGSCVCVCVCVCVFVCVVWCHMCSAGPLVVSSFFLFSSFFLLFYEP